jgi:hypothetical protein
MIVSLAEAVEFVTGERFPQDLNQWAVTRKEYGVYRLAFVSFPRCSIQADQCFAGSGDASHKEDRLAAITARFLD